MLSNFNQATRFDEFMRFALYDPQYGYYAKRRANFWSSGRFYYRPGIEPAVWANTGQGPAGEVLPRCNGVVYEFGAGTGQLACDILQAAGDLITQYNIVDVSAGLKQVQLAKLKALHGPEVEQKVRWLGELPAKLHGGWF